ncbi:MAG: electron transport complex subunit E [Desulfarculus sp.]|nr:electron transport complex subunit E [Pseudomonadota bacterium]MBV1716981.1 electron transport complex subunit E [Desulfarculus sp.]MBU4573915.1 electron transport complex subunit E [Pseudomonadota bacterium]MBU4597604.1 electron transport complex subunit E [Pseudomonadota bacterium]MBV1736557.1 electron transport complex subunit E [Desulfarculus sp.]
MSIAKEFTKGLWEIIPPFRLVLGLCPTLAVTTSAENGMGMGLATTFVLVCSNLLVSLLRKIIPSKVRIAAYVVIIASFVVIVELMMQAYTFPLYQALGIFIPLIVVNCIILGRAEAFAGKNGPVASIADGLGVGLGFTISLAVLGAFREILGSGTLWGQGLFWEGFEPFTFMVRAPGAFVALGLFLAAINLISAKLEDRKRRAQS